GTTDIALVVSDPNLLAAVQSPIAAGTNLIGKVGLDQTTPGTTNGVAIVGVNGATALAGNGTTGTGALRVTVASDNTAFTVNAAESGTWTVQPGNTANTTPWLTTPTAGTTGGATAYTPFVPAASDNHQTVKNGAGTVYQVSVSNNSATKN